MNEKRNKMIEENLALVTYSLQLLGVEYNEDYFQQGVLELIRCVDNYKEDSGRKFSTYAVNNIKWYLKEYIQRDYVIKPKRTKPRAGKVDILFCDSLDRTICADGKEVSLQEVMEDDKASNVIDQRIEELAQDSFFEYAMKEYSIDKSDLELFKDYHFNGYVKKRELSNRYGLTSKQVNSRLESVKSNLQQAYLSYNKN